MDLKKLIMAAGIGAGLMYILDPQAGRRRRVHLRDKILRGKHVTSDAMDTTARDLRNRSLGFIAQMRSFLTREEAEGAVLVERVRSQMGGSVSHPGAIHVEATDSKVILSGDILAAEVNELLKRVRSVRGVHEVENRLSVHEEPGNIPSLQGTPSRRRTGKRFELLQSNWSPAARLLTGMAGGSLTLLGIMRSRGLSKMTAMTSGLTLLARAVTNTELRELLGLGSTDRWVDIRKTIRIDAPVESVFETMSNPENFPHFMKNVQKVERTGEDRYHWRVSGPGGVPVEWDSMMTSITKNEELAWKTESGSTVEHEGRIRFHANPDGTTTLEVHLRYNPMAGKVGHVVASLFGSDPKSQMDEDLLRAKSYIETGRESRDVQARH